MICRDCKSYKLKCANCDSDNLEFRGWKENLKGLIIFPVMFTMLFSIMFGMSGGAWLGEKFYDMSILKEIVSISSFFGMFWIGYFIARKKYTKIHKSLRF